MNIYRNFRGLAGLSILVGLCISVVACSPSEAPAEAVPAAKVEAPATVPEAARPATVEAPIATTSRNALPAAPELVSLTGEAFNLAAYDDRLILLNFWATWCAPCRIEMPDLEELQSEFDEKQFKVIGIAADEMDGVKTYLETTKVTYPNFVGDPDQVFAWSERLGNRVVGVPFTALIDKTGTIRWTKMGGRISLDEVGPLVKELISE